MFSIITIGLLFIGALCDKYFIHISDLHFDDGYTPGADVNKGCCEGTGDTPNIAYVGCDLSGSTISGFLNELAKKYPNPEFVMYGGDSSPHYITVGYARMYDRDDVLTNAQEGFTRIHNAFPNTQFIPMIGNHDFYPSDQFTRNDEGIQQLTDLGELMKPYISEAQVKSLIDNGYYEFDLSDDIRIIVATTVICDNVNFYATFTGGENDFGLWDNLDAAFAKARKDGKHVIIGFHRPAGYKETKLNAYDFLAICRNNMSELYSKYQDILTYGTFTGHTHKHSFRLFSDENGKPTHVQFVSIGLTTFSDQQAGAVVYYYDESKHVITDEIEVYLDVNASNEQNKIVIGEFESLAKEYGVPDLSKESMYEIFKRNVGGSKKDAIVEKYINRIYANYDDRPDIDNTAWAAGCCGSGPVEKDLYEACTDKLSKGNSYNPDE